MRTWFLLVLLCLALTACAPQTADRGLQTMDGGPQTADHGQPTATLAPTETPTPTPTLSAPREFADAVKNNLIWYDQASGSFLVRANLRAPDGSLTEQTFTLVENSFSLNPDIKNPLAPKTVRALSPLPAGEGPGVREHT
ncbi:MAG: hypothetical protein N2049_01315, partial [Anaerolineales bacterium]|nr:hypothetical protein [Anaerolineales bacterium]